MAGVTTTSAPAGAWGPWSAWLDWLAQSAQAWMPLTPPSLNQPILPGWSFGNLTINEQNSGSPAAEKAIVAEESYGRQLGRILDALAALIQAQPAAARKQPAYAQLLEMQKKIAAIKALALDDDYARLKSGLSALKASHPEAFKQLLAEL